PVICLRHDPARADFHSGDLPERDEAEFGIAGFHELEGLSNGLALNNPCLQCVVDTQRLQDLKRCEAIRGGFRIGDGDLPEFAGSKRCRSRNQIRIRRVQHELADGIGEDRAPHAKAGLDRPCRALGIGGEKHVERRTLGDLGVELAGRPEGQDRLVTGRGVDARRDLPGGIGKVRRHGHPRCVRLGSGNRGGQNDQCGQRFQQDPLHGATQSVATITWAASNRAKADVPGASSSARALCAVMVAVSRLSPPMSSTTSAFTAETSQRTTEPPRQLRAETDGLSLPGAIITKGALISTTTSRPGTSPISRTLSSVTCAYTVVSGPTSTAISAVRVSGLISAIVPRRTLRALVRMRNPVNRWK